jgi:hypothetical protein
MADWSFNNYTFPIDCQPEHGGAGGWSKQRKVVVHQALNNDIDILTDFGFASGRRTITGSCTKVFRDQILAYFYAHTIGALVDGEGTSVSAQILSAEFASVVSDVLYSYNLVFISRG